MQNGLIWRIIAGASMIGNAILLMLIIHIFHTFYANDTSLLALLIILMLSCAVIFLLLFGLCVFSGAVYQAWIGDRQPAQKQSVEKRLRNAGIIAIILALVFPCIMLLLGKYTFVLVEQSVLSIIMGSTFLFLSWSLPRTPNWPSQKRTDAVKQDHPFYG